MILHGPVRHGIWFYIGCTSQSETRGMCDTDMAYGCINATLQQETRDVYKIEQGEIEETQEDLYCT